MHDACICAARIHVLDSTIQLSRERLRQQDLYADRDSAGDKALVMKQFLSDEKVSIQLIGHCTRLIYYKHHVKLTTSIRLSVHSYPIINKTPFIRLLDYLTTMSILKVEEINEIIEMKMTHRKNIERRKAKFGFDSVSKMGLNMVGAAVVVPDASDGTEPENPYDGKIRSAKLIS